MKQFLYVMVIYNGTLTVHKLMFRLGIADIPMCNTTSPLGTSLMTLCEVYISQVEPQPGLNTCHS